MLTTNDSIHMLKLGSLKGPVYVFLSLALPAILSINVYHFGGVSSLTAWCFFMFVAVHMVYGELSRRFDTMNRIKAGIASEKERFWIYMMVGANIMHFGMLAHAQIFTGEWQLPIFSGNPDWMDFQGTIKLLAIFSLIYFTCRPSVISGQGPVVEYGERGYWKITKHPLLAHLFLLSFLFFLQRPELSNIHLWLMGYLVIGIVHQSSRKQAVLKDKPVLDLRKIVRGFYEEFFMRPRQDCFISPLIDLTVVFALSAVIWLGNDHLYLFAIWVITFAMSISGLWYSYGLSVSNENYANYANRLSRQQQKFDKSM